MKKMSIYFQLILFVFIVKSISSNNLVSKIKELLKENNSTKSSANEFINNNKDILNNISNNLLFLYNNNFGIKYLSNKKVNKVNINENEFGKLNRYLSEKFYLNKEPINIIVILDLIESMLIDSEILENVVLKNHTGLSSLLDDLKNEIKKKVNGIFKFDESKFIYLSEFIITKFHIKTENIIDFIKLLIPNKRNHIKFVIEILKNFINKTLNNFVIRKSKEILKDCDPNFINNLVDIIYKTTKDNNLQDYFISLYFEGEINRMNISEKFKNHRISKECFLLFNKTLLGYDEQANISEVHFYRSKFMDANRGNNEFFNYERCIETGNYTGSYLNNKPVLVLSIIDATKQFKNSNNNTLYEKYYFSITTCLPQGYNETNKSVCKKEDYNEIIKISFESLVYRRVMSIFNSSELNITSFIIMKEEKLEYTKIELVSIIIALIMLIIPLIINLYLFLFKTIKIKNNNKGKIINKLDKDKENEENEDEEVEEEEIIKERKKVAFPKRIILLNYFFDLKENLKELFNFKSNLNINNMNGLNYIKGLIGISMILIVFGHTYFILFNLPLKKFGQWTFFKMMCSLFYFIPMSGLRYSPRFILSCSGFTFTYKYLSFLDKKPNNYFLKFLFQQNHKYLLLIIMFLGKALFYFFHYFFIGNSPMGELINDLLKKPKNLKDFLLSFITFNLNDSFNFEKYDRSANDLFDYFWLPFNEVLFFIIGLILISIGYKFKIRIDLIIIILFTLIYILKIVLYYIIYDGKLYSSIYYYIIDYGKVMLLPYFNLPYYLIGMYFGLMQYTIQRVIPEIEQNSYEIKNLNEDNNNNNIFKDEEKQMISHIEKSNSAIRLPSDSDLLSYTNKKGKGGFVSGKDLKIKLSDSISNKARRNIKGKYSKNIIIKTKTNDLFDDNDSNNENEDDDNTIKKKGHINDLSGLDYLIIDKVNNDNDNKIAEMPFFKITVPIIKWLKKHVENKTFFMAIMLFCIIINFLLIFNYIIFFNIYTPKDSENRKKLEKLNLEEVLTNKCYNFLYLIDIELVVLLLHWAIFIISIREQNRIYDFLRNDFWNFFVKSYFSYLLILNPIILYILYGNETIIKLGIHSINIFSLINLFFILLATIFVYVFYELPSKKIIKYIINRDYNNIYYEQENILNDKNEEEN